MGTTGPHAFIGGTTSGMTEAIASWACEAIAQDRPVVVVDAGRGAGIKGLIADACTRADRTGDLVGSDPCVPWSARLDPICGRLAMDLRRVISQAADTMGFPLGVPERIDLPLVTDLLTLRGDTARGPQDIGMPLAIAHVMTLAARGTAASRHALAHLESLPGFFGLDMATGKPADASHKSRMLAFENVLSALSEATGDGGAIDLGQAIRAGRVVHVRLDPARLSGPVVKLGSDIAFRELLRGLTGDGRATGMPAVRLAVLGAEACSLEPLLDIMAMGCPALEVGCGIGSMPMFQSRGPVAAAILSECDPKTFFGPMEDMASQDIVKAAVGSWRFRSTLMALNRPGDGIVLEGGRARRIRGARRATSVPLHRPQDLLVELPPPSAADMLFQDQLPKTITSLADKGLMASLGKAARAQGEALADKSAEGDVVACYVGALRMMPETDRAIQRACGAFGGLLMQASTDGSNDGR